MVRVAYAKSTSIKNAVRACAEQLGGAPISLLLVFCGGKHGPNAVLTALRHEFGQIPVVGGSAAGAISRTGFGYSGFELIIAAFAQDMTPRILVNNELHLGERAAGHALGDRIARELPEWSVVLLLFDSVAVTEPLRLHPASTILDGFHDGLAGHPVTVIGGGLLTDMNLSDGWVFDGSAACKHALIALVFPTCVSARTVVLHGCRPVSTFMEITSIDGAEVHELDGQPALSVIERMLGLPIGGTSGVDLSLIATLGQKQGDPYAEYDENAYVNRLILAANREANSITLFEPDFQLGTRVQIMSRDNALMLASVRDGVARLTKGLAGIDCRLALYIDCAGRASARSGAAQEEAELVIDGLDPSVPLVGFYSGVEIAPFQGYARPLDWTGVLTVLHIVA